MQTDPIWTVRYRNSAVRNYNRMLDVASRHVSAEERSILVVLHDDIDGVIVGVHGGDVQRSTASSSSVDCKLRPFVRAYPGFLQTWSRGLHLRRIEVGGHWFDVGHVRRLWDIFLVAQDVDCVLARSRRPIGYIGRTVSIVLAVDLGLRWTLD